MIYRQSIGQVNLATVKSQSMLSTLTHVLTGRNNRPILLDIKWDKEQTQKGLVIFVHGYKGFKDWGAWNLVSEKFARAGYTFLKFNFSHNGTTPEHPEDFVDLEAFSDNNYSIELDEIRIVTDWALSSKEVPKSKQTSLIGHSRGGGLAILGATEDERIDKLITWAAVSDFGDRFPIYEDLHQWRWDGIYHVLNGRTGQKMPHKYQWYKDFKENEERLYIRRHARKYTKPSLIVHALDDLAVHGSAAMRIHKWIKTSQIILKDDGGHTFGMSHPWEKENLPIVMNDVVARSISFLSL